MSCPRLFEPVDAEHLQTCAECRAVQEALQTPATAGIGVDLERLKGPALAAFKEQPVARAWWFSALGFVAICTIATAVAMTLYPPKTTQHASMMLRQVSAAAWALCMVAGCFLAVRPGARGPRLALLAGVAGCFVMTLAAASGVGPPGLGSVGCALTEWGVALVPFAVGMMVLTGFAFDVTRALAGGVGAMSAGMLTLHLHCPNGTLQHQAAFHLAPIVVLMLVGLVLRRRLPSRTHAP